MGDTDNAGDKTVLAPYCGERKINHNYDCQRHQARDRHRGRDQLGEAVSQMNQTTQQNATRVEQSAAAAESLRQQTQQMVRAVAVFKLNQR